MLDAIIWGFVQGLTEFLPISSSGHLVLVPALASAAGVEVGDPSLAVSAVLHLGTLLAVVIFYRKDLASLISFREDAAARRVLTLLAIGTIPAIIGLPLRGRIEALESSPRIVALALIATGIILAISTRSPNGRTRLEDASIADAVIVGVSQALALIPGISRSGTTITTGLFRGLERAEAARFSFLLAIPTIAGAGLLSLADLTETSSGIGQITVGFIVSAITGYVAITWLLKIIATRSFMPFAIYCFLIGGVSLIVL